jgi:hypothetical protein
MQLFAIDRDRETAPPLAPLALLGEGEQPGTHWWLRADPVHLIPDLHRLRLGDPAQLQLQDDEARELAAIADQLFAAAGAQLHPVHPTRWYLRLQEDPRLTTRYWSGAVGAPADDSLPGGPGSAPWRRLLTEIQMSLHTSAANHQRESRGLPNVNALWLWGGGRLPQPGATRLIDGVVGEDPVLRGLARLTGARELQLPLERALTGLAGTLIVRDDRTAAAVRGGNIEAWVAALSQLEAQLFAPLLEALSKGKLAALHIDAAAGTVYSLRRYHLRRFWRRVRALHDYL